MSKDYTLEPALTHLRFKGQQHAIIIKRERSNCNRRVTSDVKTYAITALDGVYLWVSIG